MKRRRAIQLHITDVMLNSQEPEVVVLTLCSFAGPVTRSRLFQNPTSMPLTHSNVAHCPHAHIPCEHANTHICCSYIYMLGPRTSNINCNACICFLCVCVPPAHGSGQCGQLYRCPLFYFVTFTDATALTQQVLHQMTDVVCRLLLQWSDSACPLLGLGMAYSTQSCT